MTPAADAGAGGAPDAAVVDQAVQWMARLWSEEAADADRAACARWRAAHPDHELAWRRLQAMHEKFDGVPRGIAQHALRVPTPDPAARRRVLAALGLAGTAALAYPLARQAPALQAMAADARSATGEIRGLTLPDGTRLVLDTASAVNLRYDEHERRILLLRGRILVETESDPAGRPLRVESAQGTVEALGTVFSVQQEDGVSLAAVHAGAVDIRPAQAHGLAVRVEAGQRARYTTRAAHAPTVLDMQQDVWRQGQLVAQDMRLADLLAELSRYRPGLLRHDPALSELRVTGVFSLTDTDRTLANLAEGLGLKLISRTRYWVTLQPG
ncbi:Fe2+-dicitrate sensor, membrane component [plant metagenome]|uniref:Fe2+-dicitrate sensor, membrane component n=1 Tax=plant metagenome TaxID=1297885 RepID=A0A484P293_9ZZZZ